ncbi:GNAT family N-acetyltransferase [Lacisediminihabitans changchengi]|uniref:GNAT family N-acetyltransferase n=1 Tax=Lacisediminihabitans changchengi TaxID=2787634 RepID=UPI001F401F5D|nr:GNAT family protein [Lacisediminihabitans changchengi]
MRGWRADDASALLRAVTVSDDLGPQFGGTTPADIHGARRAIGILGATSDAVCNFAIELNGIAVGNVGISAMEDRHGTGWVYYWLSAEARGRGLASAALATAANWAFSDRGLFRLELGHRTNNPASCAVARAAGFIAEGVERQKLRYGTDRFDVETHGRLATDPSTGVALLPITVG